MSIFTQLRKFTAIGVLVLSVMAPQSADAAIILTPKPMPVSIDHLVSNGDGYLVGWTRNNAWIKICIFDKDINPIKEFDISNYDPNVYPYPIFLCKSATDETSLYATQHVFNKDDMWEVALSNGDVYNENGFYIGHISNFIMMSPEESVIYNGYNDTGKIEESDLLEAWLPKYDGEIKDFMRETFKLTDNNHSDFGIPAMLMHIESAGIDNVGVNGGYNWFKSSQDYKDKEMQSPISAHMIYYYPNMIIARLNAILAQTAGAGDEGSKFIRSQCHALRAYLNHIMVQCAQHSYDTSAELPGLPVVDENNFLDAPTKGIKRATVAKTYEFILSDLDKAIESLNTKDVRDFQVITEGERRTFISLAAAYGLRARVKLVMRDYQGAYEDAAMAIDRTDATPLSRELATIPGFEDMTASDWMWGLRYRRDDRASTSGIVNFSSHFSPFYSGGYFSVSARRVNHSLVDGIQVGDVRRAWYLDGNGNTDVLPDDYASFLTNLTTNDYAYLPTKFSPKNGAGSGNYDAPNDYPLLRVEEMYYIMAEALAGLDRLSEAKTVLTAFENQFRNPSFTAQDFTTSAGLIEEIARLRRLEFWGEGISLFDLMRLHKGVDRRKAGYSPEHLFIIKDGDPLLLWRFPQTCASQNATICDEQNGDAPAPPEPKAEDGYAVWSNVKDRSVIQLYKDETSGSALRFFGNRIRTIVNEDASTASEYPYIVQVTDDSETNIISILTDNVSKAVVPSQTAWMFGETNGRKAVIASGSGPVAIHKPAVMDIPVTVTDANGNVLEFDMAVNIPLPQYSLVNQSSTGSIIYEKKDNDPWPVFTLSNEAFEEDMKIRYAVVSDGESLTDDKWSDYITEKSSIDITPACYGYTRIYISKYSYGRERERVFNQIYILKKFSYSMADDKTHKWQKQIEHEQPYTFSVYFNGTAYSDVKYYQASDDPNLILMSTYVWDIGAEVNVKYNVSTGEVRLMTYPIPAYLERDGKRLYAGITDVANVMDDLTDDQRSHFDADGNVFALHGIIVLYDVDGNYAGYLNGNEGWEYLYSYGVTFTKESKSRMKLRKGDAGSIEGPAATPVIKLPGLDLSKAHFVPAKKQ